MFLPAVIIPLVYVGLCIGLLVLTAVAAKEKRSVAKWVCATILVSFIGAPFIPAPGFTSGVAAASTGPRDACVLVFGCTDAALRPDTRALVRGYTLLTATYTSGPMAHLPSAACPLTDRELDCLRLAAMGMSSKEAAPLLGISWRTDDVFLARARGRLGVDTTFGATMSRLDYGWINMDESDQATG